jgi:hypothetical protein
MLFVPKNRDDISRYYRGTYLKLKEFGDELFLIEHVEANAITGKHESGKPFIIYLDDETPYEVDYILPHKSFYQDGANAVQLVRVPAKQYYRGLCASNTALVTVSNVGVIKQGTIDFNSLKKFVYKQAFFSLKAAIGTEGNITCAMSSRMMYHRSKRELYIDQEPIAKVNPGKLQISLYYPIFANEVMDVLKSHNEHNIFSLVAGTPPPKPVKEKAVKVTLE